jgi:hypothetical protein
MAHPPAPPPAPALCQFDRARELFVPIAEACETYLPALQELLAEAQNAPPHGFADGSIPEALWNELAEVKRAAEAIVYRRQRIRALVQQLQAQAVAPPPPPPPPAPAFDPGDDDDIQF